jgi:hypothetical protein
LAAACATLVLTALAALPLSARADVHAHGFAHSAGHFSAPGMRANATVGLVAPNAPTGPGGQRWVRGWHGGLWGWWWWNAGYWSWYETAPYWAYPYTSYLEVVPVQVEPALAPAAPPAPALWYYCDPARAYYPYVPTCPVPWRAVPAAPPGAQGPVSPSAAAK